ncbi:hypothetical protein SISSUDRAFT_690580 [Sistotremastrum suecicum HHB10207 ss-3]|uniref:2-amino-4-hydroxy-6-hydroxymethyldihydropteridine diphosphokinase n=1 Tax=Sistotremastrum suecicum HHB10207 ss-3 TaxID=1314776 RepID=A0A166I465_9AGAM|nr:hypothetical protein SISSUDRAFT_690580 [Sistotremastrum suecicum HHB10207 ss-3]
MGEEQTSKSFPNNWLDAIASPISNRVPMLVIRAFQSARTLSYKSLEGINHFIPESISRRSQRLFTTSTFSRSPRMSESSILHSALARVPILKHIGSRSLSDSSPAASVSHDGRNLAIIALGSNIPDRFANIEAGLRLLEHNREETQILETSFMYETDPMYVTAQDRFANCACLVRLQAHLIILRYDYYFR